MDLSELKSIMATWNFWDRPPPPSVSRAVALPAKLHSDLILVIQGVRRCGKSTLLSQLPIHYSIDWGQCYFCNFEDPRLMTNLDHTLLENIVTMARSEHPSSVPCYFFFDEIQEVKNWEKFLNQHIERPQNNFFIITGSNSSLLSGELGSSLTGRHLTLELYPFKFSEFKTLFPQKKLEDYLQQGGFPKPILFENPQKLLQEYFNDIVYRDVTIKAASRNTKAILQVAKMTFEACGSELSFRKISSITQLTVDTVKSYLEALEQAYLLFQCPLFSFSERKQILNNKKYYPIDPALRTAITHTAERDLGKNLETLVFLRLKETYEQVFYFSESGKGEVDFVVLKGSRIIPYQVSLSEPQPRHQKALDYFYQRYPQAEEAVFISLENADQFL